MEKHRITEIVSFEIDKSIHPETFKEIVDFVETEFHMQQAGYIDSELVKENANSWLMIMHWASLDAVKQASKRMMKSDLTIKFRQVIIPSTVKMRYLEQINQWKK